MKAKIALCSVVVMFAASNATAQDWPHWRGPNFNGSTQAKDLPAKFTQKKNVRWAAKMPGPGASTPVVVGERIFLSSVDTEKQELVALCVNRIDGKVLWQKTAGSGYAGSSRSPVGSGRATFACPSPVADQTRVVFFFGNGDLVSYDHKGKELWRRNIQKDYGNFSINFSFSASPTLWEDRVFLPVLQRDSARGRGRRRGGDDEEPQKKLDSYVLAVDANTGKTIYRHVRLSPARMESLESYTTLIPHVGKKGRRELLLAGGDVLTGHDPETGKELWRWGTWNEGHRQGAWRLVPSVVVGEGLALVCAPKRAPVYAIRLGGKGTLDEKALAWKSEGRRTPVTSDVPTPAFHEGHFYLLSDQRNVLCKLRAKDGEVIWKTDVPREFVWRTSPTVADGKVYFMNHNGEVIVADAENGKILHRAFMGDVDDDQTRSTVVVAHNNIFVRTNARLFCIGKP